MMRSNTSFASSPTTIFSGGGRTARLSEAGRVITAAWTATRLRGNDTTLVEMLAVPCIRLLRHSCSSTIIACIATFELRIQYIHTILYYGHSVQLGVHLPEGFSRRILWRQGFVVSSRSHASKEKGQVCALRRQPSSIAMIAMSYIV